MLQICSKVSKQTRLFKSARPREMAGKRNENNFRSRESEKMAEALLVLSLALFVALSACEDVLIDGSHAPFPDILEDTIDIDSPHRIFTKEELLNYDGKNVLPYSFLNYL